MSTASRERAAGGGAPRQLSRPKDEHDLLAQLVAQGPFQELRDVLVIAAVVAWHENRRQHLAARDEPIRWEVATNRRGTEPLVDMIAASASGDPKIIADHRSDERLAIFEEYANGASWKCCAGCSPPNPGPRVDVVLELVQKVPYDRGAGRAPAWPTPLTSCSDSRQLTLAPCGSRTRGWPCSRT